LSYTVDGYYLLGPANETALPFSAEFEIAKAYEISSTVCIVITLVLGILLLSTVLSCVETSLLRLYEMLLPNESTFVIDLRSFGKNVLACLRRGSLWFSVVVIPFKIMVYLT